MTNTDTMMSAPEAAAYAKLPLPYFRNLIKHGKGPAFVVPNDRVRFFTKQNMDNWIATWKQVASRTD